MENLATIENFGYYGIKYIAINIHEVPNEAEKYYVANVDHVLTEFPEDGEEEFRVITFDTNFGSTDYKGLAQEVFKKYIVIYPIIRNVLVFGEDNTVIETLTLTEEGEII